MASKRPPRGPQDGSKIDQKSIKNRWFYEVEKAGFCDPSHTLGPFYSDQKTCIFWTSIFHQFFICFALVFIFVLFKTSSWGHFFGENFFFLRLKAAPGPNNLFFEPSWCLLRAPPDLQNVRFAEAKTQFLHFCLCRSWPRFGTLKIVFRGPQSGSCKLFQV